MLTLKDCLAMCDLEEDEILAIAEHENMMEIAALELAQCLCERPHGLECVKRFLLDDMAAARTRGDFSHLEKLRRTLHHFVAAHPV